MAWFLINWNLLRAHFGGFHWPITFGSSEDNLKKVYDLPRPSEMNQWAILTPRLCADDVLQGVAYILKHVHLYFQTPTTLKYM